MMATPAGQVGRSAVEMVQRSPNFGSIDSTGSQRWKHILDEHPNSVEYDYQPNVLQHGYFRFKTQRNKTRCRFLRTPVNG